MLLLTLILFLVSSKGLGKPMTSFLRRWQKAQPRHVQRAQEGKGGKDRWFRESIRPDRMPDGQVEQGTKGRWERSRLRALSQMGRVDTQTATRAAMEVSRSHFNNLLQPEMFHTVAGGPL